MEDLNLLRRECDIALAAFPGADDLQRRLWAQHFARQLGRAARSAPKAQSPITTERLIAVAETCWLIADGRRPADDLVDVLEALTGPAEEAVVASSAHSAHAPLSLIMSAGSIPAVSTGSG
jgi:hypothetical protein